MFGNVTKKQILCLEMLQNKPDLSLEMLQKKLYLCSVTKFQVLCLKEE